MSFRDPHQQHHKIQGLRKAADSPKTPAHLRPHIQKKIKEHESMFNKTTEAGRHAKGASVSNVKLPSKKSQPQTAGQSPKTASYSQMHPVREAELRSTSNTSRDLETQVKAPPMPFKTKNSMGQGAPATAPANGTHDYDVTGITGRPSAGKMPESLASTAGATPVPKAHAPSGGMNQAKIGKGPGDSAQPIGKRTPKKSLFFGE